MQELIARSICILVNHLITLRCQNSFSYSFRSLINLENRRTALKWLINRLDQNLDHEKKSKNANVSDLIQLTEDDLYTLPPAFEITVVDIPGQELFNKGVIKQHPALNFALKCSLLRVAIFEKLQNNTSEERTSFTSMSEWLEMVGETWKKIIKYQGMDMFSEVHIHRDLEKAKPTKENSLRKESDEPHSQVLTRFKTFSAQHFPSVLNITRYRMLYSDSFSDQLQRLTYQCKSSAEIMDSLIPLALYYLNCNLPFIQLLKMVDSKILDIPTPVDLVHILFQNSEKLLRAIILNHYSFSNPIPFYYPIIKPYCKKDSVEYTISHELWYSLNPHNAVVSFGLGIAANDPIGKSTLLDRIFELNFTPNSTINSCFHAGSIDLRLTKNFFSSVTCDANLVNWAFFDFHAPTNFEIVKILLKQVSIVLIHIYEKDLIKNFKNIENYLRSFDLKGKHVYIFIRDESEGNHENSFR